MQPIDYDLHNAEVKQIWESYNSGKPIRVPVILGVNPRYYLLDPALNTEKITFEDYFKDPDTMVEVQVKFQHYLRHHLLQDAEMGLPKDGWPVWIDFQNSHEAAWFGCEVHYYPDQVPDTRPFLTDDNKRMLFDRGLPDPLKDNIMSKNLWFYEHILSDMSKYVYYGLPVLSVHPSGMGTDGPFTAACNIRGATEICTEIYSDPDYVHELLDYITQSIILRIKTLRRHFLKETENPQGLAFADDSIELLSTETYREFVLPYHRRLIEELSKGGPNGIHLCGDAARHFRAIRDELNVNAFDTGYPIDFAGVRKELGPEVQIAGGPTVALLLYGTPGDIEDEVKRILDSGVTDGGRFILREANNLSPRTPVENVKAMYEAARKYGNYS